MNNGLKEVNDERTDILDIYYPSHGDKADDYKDDASKPLLVYLQGKIKMANEQNLLKGDERHKFTPEEHSRGGKASAAARRERKKFSEVFEQFLNSEFKDKSGQVKSGAEALGLKVVEKALKGDLKAFELIRDTVGEKPVEKIAKVDISTEVRAEVEALANDYEQRYSSRDTGE